MNRKVWVGVLVVGLVLAPVALRAIGTRTEVEVELARPAQRELRTSVLASGNLEYQTQAVLSPEVLARVARVLVKEGDTVKAGDVVMVLDDRGLSAERNQYAAALERERILASRSAKKLELQSSILARNKQLHSARLIEDARLDQLKDDVISASADVHEAREASKQAAAALNQAEDRLSKTVITSPIDGTVTALRIKVGETAVPSSTGIAGSNLMTVADTGSIMAKIYVDEADVGRVRMGQKVAVFAASAEDVPLEGVVAAIALSPREPTPGAQAAQIGRSYPIEVKLAPATKPMVLRPGMTCRAEVYVSTTEKVLTIPQQAVFEREPAQDARAPNGDGSHFVWVAHEGAVSRRPVAVGATDDTYQEVKSGLSSRDLVVVGPYKTSRTLADGAAIRQVAPAP